jgi:hypothetical protein
MQLLLGGGTIHFYLKSAGPDRHVTLTKIGAPALYLALRHAWTEVRLDTL